ncbi:LysR family transcriptional regulator [Roseibium sp. RKSG952]|uniref:LysR family transcriptional regulator n=1 Tax=Roseibium sp. RKSG952 TaxID=2529384 RepID=UPI0012BD363C|nr:LysR family transcriptional regulator [Roseibium sp. RKSG952]MTH97542.1 LysR family transcriptional regulator [Roseibium sp. RKSG952]
MDKLTALTSFVQAAKLGSFSAAAGHLGVSQPAISQQVRTLEDHLGTRLLNRTTRRLSLTEAGERYLSYATDILEQIDEADRSIQSAEAQMRGRLSVSLPYAFAEPLLASFLINFKTSHPDIRLDVHLSDSFVDLQKERVDLAIRMGVIEDERQVVRKLGDMQRCLVASPSYLERMGRPKHPEDLTAHAFVLYPSMAESGRLVLSSPSGKQVRVPFNPVMLINNSAALRQAAMDGVGITLAVTWLAQPGISRGDLETVLDGWMHTPHPVHAVYPSNRFIPLKVRRFVDAYKTFMMENGAFQSHSPPC